MKGKFKKLLAIGLAMIMLFAMMPTLAFAGEFTTGGKTYTSAQNEEVGALIDKTLSVSVFVDGVPLESYTMGVGLGANAFEIRINSAYADYLKISSISGSFTGEWETQAKDRFKGTLWAGANPSITMNLTHVDMEHLHDIVTYEVPATCTGRGLQTLKCHFCDNTSDQIISAKGHRYGSWTGVDNERHKRVCLNDDSHVESGNCVYIEDPDQFVAATTQAEGKKVFSCNTCENSYDEPLSQLPVKLTYDANGGTGEPADELITAPVMAHPLNDKDIPSHEPVDGVSVLFAGWTETKVDAILDMKSEPLNDISEINIDGVESELTVYAAYSLDTNDDGIPDIFEEQYTLEYNPAGGAGGPGIIQLLEQRDYVLATIPAPTHDDVEGNKVLFLGWTEELDEKIYAETDTRPSLLTTIDIPEITTVYAVYALDKDENDIPDIMEKEVTLSYNANGGKNAPPSQKARLDPATGSVSIALSTLKPERDGHSFVKWNEEPDGSGLGYGLTTHIVIEEDTVLYAIWQENPTVTYTLKYDANGGKNPPDAQILDSNTGSAEFTLTDKAPTRAGYKFLGWAKTNNAQAAELKPGDKLSVTEQTTTLFAVYSKDGTGTENGGNGKPKTGDENNIALWATLLSLSAAGMGTALYFGKKKKAC